MGGSDDKDNLVRLTGREHWIAHLLLWKIHRNTQCLSACHMMAMRCEERGIPQIRNSRMYEAIRIRHAELTSFRHRAFTGKKNSQFGTKWICNPTLKQNQKITKADKIPTGWIPGRNRWKIQFANRKRDSERMKKKQLKLEAEKAEALHTWKEYQSGNWPSANAYAKACYSRTLPTLTSLWKRYIPEYAEKSQQGKSFKWN